MTYQVQVTIPYFNNIPRDCVTNVHHFNAVGVGVPTELQYEALDNILATFYNDVYTNPQTFASYAVNVMNTKVYNLADPSPRVAVHEASTVLSVSVSTNTTIPPEVAVVASIHAAPATGFSAARLRGRIYLGAIGDGAVAAGASSAFPTVAEGFRTDVNGAANALVGAAVAAGWNWVVYSRAGALAHNVVGGHCDDAFDTQRRRGQDPTIRNTWP